MWKNFVREYLSFTKNQRRGLYILLFIILCCMVAPLLFPYFVNPAEEKEKEAFKKDVTTFLNAQQVPTGKNKDSVEKITLFPFDPNKISTDDWQRLGISKRVAITIQHYREAGGLFYKKEDLKKIYGLSDKAYQELAPYIHIRIEKQSNKKHFNNTSNHFNNTSNPRSVKKTPHKKFEFHKEKALSIDINKADSAAWRQLYGIGPVLSARIVRYRKALGGFYKTEQIAEVYNLPDSTFQRIKNQLIVSTDAVKKLHINTASEEKLKSHSYINYYLAKSITAYRKMHGKFDSLPQLKELQLVDDQIYRKLAPYLTVK